MKRTARAGPRTEQASVNRVRELRELRGVSQVALAEAAGVSRQSINAIEAGRSTPSVDLAIRIAQRLQCRVEDVFAPQTSDARVEAEPGLPGKAERVALAQVGGVWRHYPLAGWLTRAADGLLG